MADSGRCLLSGYINSDQRDPNVQVVPERDQHRPATPYERIPVTLVEEKA